MTDTNTGKPIRVETHPEAGAWFDLPTSQVDDAKRILEENSVPHWVSLYSISFDGRPPVTRVVLRYNADPVQAQHLLDGLP